ncbi:MAG: hypothetical protein ACREH9_10800, partial [Pseudomonadota bacterium]
MPPFKPGVTLKGGFRIVELISQSSIENRYRAERERAGQLERFQLRERAGSEPMAANIATDASVEANTTTAEAHNPPTDEDPNGPHAKTAELKLRAVSAEALPPPADDNAPLAGTNARTGADDAPHNHDTCHDAAHR